MPGGSESRPDRRDASRVEDLLAQHPNSVHAARAPGATGEAFGEGQIHGVGVQLAGRAPLAKPPAEDQPHVVGLPPEVAREHGVLLRGYRPRLDLVTKLGADGTPLD